MFRLLQIYFAKAPLLPDYVVRFQAWQRFKVGNNKEKKYRHDMNARPGAQEKQLSIVDLFTFINLSSVQEENKRSVEIIIL